MTEGERTKKDDQAETKLEGVGWRGTEGGRRPLGVLGCICRHSPVLHNRKSRPCYYYLRHRRRLYKTGICLLVFGTYKSCTRPFLISLSIPTSDITDIAVI